MDVCAICHAALGDPVYVSPGQRSLTSMGETVSGHTVVYRCLRCGHLQTPPFEDIDDYYAHSYTMLLDSEEEDQLYAVVDGQPVYRADHQVATLLAKTQLPQGARVLDYGAGKGLALARLMRARPDLIPHVYEVSGMYVPFWTRALPDASQAVGELDPEWRGNIDLVVSNFVLEHVPRPQEALDAITAVMAPAALLYFIVPSTYTNASDFIVADHVHHFCETSLQYLLEDAGYDVVAIDDAAHRGAFVCVARRAHAPRTREPDPERLRQDEAATAAMADMWRDAGVRLREFEQNSAGAVAIYGSGFYGAFIASCLHQLDRVTCFVDRNPFRHGKTVLDKPIVGPEALPEEVACIYVGLNPKIARKAIEDVDAWRKRGLRYFYL